MSAVPYPAPTPYQGPQQGGNANVPQGFIGPMIPTNFIGPLQTNYSPTYTRTTSTTPTSTPTQQPTAPSGGNVLGTTSTPTAPSTYYDQGTGMTFGSYDEFMGEVNNAFNPQFGYLNEAEAALRKDYPNVLAAAQSEYDTSAKIMDNNKQSSLGKTKLNREQGQRRKEDVISAARRTLQEVGQGALQRFGGASSAGQAASEIQGREFMRQTGDTNRQGVELNAQIDQQESEIENNFQAGMMQLKQKLQEGIAQAGRDFQQKLLDIMNNRTQLESAKAQARLSALMDLRNKVFAIQQQNLQFEQNLAAMKEQARLNIQGFAQTAGNAASTAQNAFNSFTGNTTTNPQFSSTVGGRTVSFNQQPQYIGQIGKSIMGKDELGRNIYDDGTAGWTKYQ